MTRSHLPPLAAIRVFEAAARHRNFTTAAAELGMTQAAVSYQIKVLEERVGATLFLRRARGVELSEIGAQFAQKSTDALDILGDAFARARGRTEETLVISVIPTFATNFLAQRLGCFQIDNPSIAVRVEVSQSLVDFASDGFDLAIRSGKGNWPGLKSHLLVPVAYTPMLSPALAEKAGGIHQPADLLKLPIVEPSDPWWHQWFAEAGVTDANLATQPGLQFGSQVLEANAAIAGQGIGILTPAFYQDEVKQNRLYQPFDLVCNADQGYWLVYPENRRNLAKIKLFRNWLETKVAEFNQE